MKKKYIAGMFALMTLMIQAQPLPPPAVGNRPHIITDDANPQTVYGAMEFNDGSNSGQEYFYDACGSLVADANKGIAHIEYDNLNYPKKIQFTNGNTIEYVYTPDGQKLRAKYQTAIDNIVVPLNTTTTLSNSQIVNTTQTDYIGNVIYTGTSSGASTTTSLNKYLFEGGYATFNNSIPVYHYYTQDHLGNNRAVVSDNGTVEQITHYYPFGGTFSDVGLNSSLQPYKYNGKELDRMHGLDLYDYGARQYDPIVPMFTQVDPLAEKYYNVSPYAYCLNNPIKYIDPDGRKIRIRQKDQKQILGYINKLARGLFAVDKKGYLYLAKSSNTKGFSETFTKSLVDAINNKDNTINVFVDDYYIDSNEKKQDISKKGEGTTKEFANGDFSVVISGKSYEKLVDKDGNSISDRPEYILAHEIAGHAEPRMNNKEGKVKNAVEIENQIRRETNEKDRKEEPDHVQ